MKFWLKLSEPPKNVKDKRNEEGKRKIEEKNAKNLLLVFVKVKLDVKKSVLVRIFLFVKQTFLTNTSKKHKNALKSEKMYVFLQIFLSFTKEIWAKLIELESESEMFT